ncbi:hypothetical protein AB0K40_18075 [Nonomuraea bangladeshensis]|uniref:DUF4178 domain-containing protein n=1 Tax=Nonomuraea bangladeshensis TaxID=404385 RepID=A0ABV3H4G4_9ACTN
MTYLPGETVQVTLIGKVAEVRDREATGDWSEIHIDVEDAEGGISLRIPTGWPAVAISRVIPAAGQPKPGELWTTRHGQQLFVTEDRHGAPQFTTTDGRVRSIADMNNYGGPLTPIYQLPERELEPDWTWDDEDDPRTATDPAGTVWDLTARFRDGEGRTWHYAGGFGRRDGDDGPIQPLLSRDDWSQDAVPIGLVPGPLTPLPRDESPVSAEGAGEG